MAKIAEFDVSKVGVQSDSPVVDQEPRVSAIGMGRDSLEFLDAAKELAGERDASQLVMRHLHPMYYLLCHSMELSLKAYLRTKGYEDSELKKLWHGLEDAVEVVKREGLTLSQDFIDMAMWLGPYHSDNAFRYQKTRRLHIPLAHDLIDMIEPQIRQTFAIVNRRVLDYLRKQP
jgi:hypothetical protein